MSKKDKWAYRNGKLRLMKRDGCPNWIIVGRHDGRNIRVTSGTDDLQKAKRRVDDLLFELESGWRRQAISTEGWTEIAMAMVNRQRYAARARGIPFELSVKDVLGLMQAAEYRCAVSGIAFARERDPETRRDPWAPSIDRIDARHGYTAGNVRVVCYAANLAMSNWGYDTLLRLSNAVVRRSAIASREASEAEIHKHVQDTA